LDHLTLVAEQFAPEGGVTDVREYGSGNVNDTFLVSLNSGEERNFILQRINTHVFSRPELVMLNIRTFTEHVCERLRRERVGPGRRWQVPRVLPARDGNDYFIDPQGSFWRSISFVNHSKSYETVQGIAHAREAGYALGRFHSLISDLGTAKLHDTLEGFHVTPRYLQHYDEVLARNGVEAGSPQVRYCLQFVEGRRNWAAVLEDAKEQHKLSLRPIHGDPKINNIMIDEATGQAVSIVDLDTIKPGLVHYDIGDCLRSCCNPLGEETDNLGDVHFDTDLCEAILQGYLSVASDFLDVNDYFYLYDAIRLIAFELGLRFFTDYLEGNVYFKARHEAHNLSRALVQFKLTESIESQEADIRRIIDGLM
jgi:Ser/Thr protein kinase RdoA (MazF antagonist)